MINLLRYNTADNAFDNILRGFLLRPMYPDGAQDIQIKLDVMEDDSKYVVNAVIPGAKKEDIHVAIDENQITISAEVKNATEIKDGEKLLCSERSFGKMSRVFTLAQEVDNESSTAKYNNGVLELTLQKKPETMTKQLLIN